MKTRKLLAILVAVAMTVTMLPVVAFAQEVFSVTFTVKDVDDNPIEGAIVKLGDKEPETTDPEGQVVFTGVEAGTYAYEVERAGFEPETGSVVVTDADVDMTVTLISLSPLVPYSAAGSKVLVDENKVRVNKEVEFTVQFVDSQGLVKNGNVLFFVKSNRDAEEITSITEMRDESSDGLEDGKGIIATTDGNGIVKFKLKSGVPGSAEIAVYRVPGAGGVDGWVADEALLIGKETITFTEPTTVDTVQIQAPAEVQAGVEFELVATAKKGGIAQSGVKVEFYEAKSRTGNYTKIGEKETNVLGQATLKITREKADTYYYRAKVGSTWVSVDDAAEVEVVAGPYHTVVADTADGNIPLDKEKTVTFLIKDRYGNKIKGTALESIPVDADLDAPKDSDADLEEAHGYQEGELKYKFTPDVAGKYVVEVKIRNTGLSAKATFNAAEFGEIKEIQLGFDGDKNVLRAGLETPDELKLKVSAVDENGLKYTLTDGLRFVSSDTALAKIPNVSEGKVVATDKDDRSGVVTVTVTHLETGLQDSIEIPVAGSPAGIDVDVEVDDKTATVTMQFVDKNGLRTYDEDGDVEFTVVAAGVKVSDVKDFSKDTGKGSFKATVEEYGEYSVRVISNNGLAKTFTINFGAPKAEYGAQKVLLTIGSKVAIADGKVVEMDVAPFIEEGRTFVPVRFLAEAFGAEADWTPKDAPVETVFLTREDMTITIGIGDSFLTVTKDGEAEVVTFDAPARIKNSRTFLPFRAIAEAFGADVDYGTDAEGYVTWVSFEQ